MLVQKRNSTLISRHAHMTSVSIINSWFIARYKTARAHLVFFIKTWITVLYNCEYLHLLRKNQTIPRQPPPLRIAHKSTDRESMRVTQCLLGTNRFRDVPDTAAWFGR